MRLTPESLPQDIYSISVEELLVGRARDNLLWRYHQRRQNIWLLHMQQKKQCGYDPC